MSTITKAPETGKHRAGKPAKVETERPVKVKSGGAPKPRRPRGRKLRFVALLLLVAVTVGAAVAAFLVHRSNAHARSLQAVESARKGAVAAAATDVPKILGYDYRHLSEDIKAAKAISTGQFLTDYTSTAQKVLASAPSIKAIVTATVSGQSVVQAQRDRVTLLLFVDQESVKQLKGQKTATTRIDPFRVQLTMSMVRGHWMVSNLEPI